MNPIICNLKLVGVYICDDLETGSITLEDDDYNRIQFKCQAENVLEFAKLMGQMVRIEVTAQF